MINIEKLQTAVAAYKEHFPQQWENEKYKWEAIKHFQDHWDVKAPDFTSMFMEATEKAKNLLTSWLYYPRNMIRDFSNADSETVRGMFISLFNESIDISKRIEMFRADSEAIRNKYNDGSWKQHFQDLRAITVYLWLKYPDKYYIYKYSVVHSTADVLESKFIPKKGSSTENIIGTINLYNEIHDYIKQDSDLVQMFNDALTENCYSDPELRTLSGDIGYFISRYYEKKKPSLNKKNVYWPSLEKYDPKLSKEDWKKFLAERELPEHPNTMRMLKGLLDLGGEASCKQLSEAYGGHPSSYVAYSVDLGRRAKQYFDLPPCMDGNVDRCFVIPFIGRHSEIKDQGTYIYKLRPELYEALQELDLSDIDPHISQEDEKLAIQLPMADNANEIYTSEQFLNEVFISEERFDTLVSLLRNKKNVILQGAPGVGKTFAARRLAYAMMGEKDDSRIEFVQFHQNYSYEDFVMGYRPDGDGFKLTEGVFYRFCKKAAASDKEYFFIIDEINRGNMSKIFGELLMLIERGYRNVPLTLGYTGEPFSVPENLYIIGMMNTADRSLAMIDYALRRRFSFFEMEPAFNSEGFRAYQRQFNNEMLDDLIDTVKNLNIDIEKDDSLGPGFRIGHSYFCIDGEFTEERMKEIVYYDVIPMLEEYWFDDNSSLQTWKNRLSGVFDD